MVTVEVVVVGAVVVVSSSVVVTGGLVVVGWPGLVGCCVGPVSSTVVVVVVPSALVTVVTRVRFAVVVVVVSAADDDVLSVVVVTPTGSAADDGVRETVVRVSRLTTSSRGVGAGAAPGLAPAKEAMVANTVDTATPDAASSQCGDTRLREPSGSGVRYSGVPCSGVSCNGAPKVIYQPKFWVQYQPRVSRPTPIVVNPQFRMLRRWPSEFIHAFMTCSAERWPFAMFSPPGFG